MRLDFGEFQVPDDPEPNWFARSRFLATVTQLVPAVLQDLRSHALPSYRQLDAELRTAPQFINGQLHHGWDSIIAIAVADTSPAGLPPLIASMLRWAQQYHLAEDWVLNQALGTLYRWVSGAGQDVWQGVGRSWGYPLSPESISFDFSAGGWDPVMARRKDYEQRLHDVFALRLREYLDRVEADTEERGWTRTKEWRELGRTLEGRFTPLVRWQVEQWTRQRIAEEAGCSIRQIRTILVVSAKEIGLTLRRGRSGNPRTRPLSR